MDKRFILLNMFLLSRFVVKTGKILNTEKTMTFLLLGLLVQKPRTIQELANLLTVNHSFMSSTLSKMEKVGFIQKTVHKDQRCRLITLGEKSQSLRETFKNEGYKIADILFKNMTEDEINQFGQLLSKLNLDFKKVTKLVKFDFTSMV